jgi:hypothetical protein
MKIRFLKGTTVAGGKSVNPGEVHDVSSDDAHRFVKLYRDAEIYTEPVKVEEPAEVPIVESKKGTKKL